MVSFTPRLTQVTTKCSWLERPKTRSSQMAEPLDVASLWRYWRHPSAILIYAKNTPNSVNMPIKTYLGSTFGFFQLS